MPAELQSGATGGTYEEVFANPEVDVVYIGTPHTYHYENTMDALNAGKHVLCEKVSRSGGSGQLGRVGLLIAIPALQPFTFDVEELDELTALAKKKNLFLMEAVWTRFVSTPSMSPRQRLVDTNCLIELWSGLISTLSRMRCRMRSLAASTARSSECESFVARFSYR